jgi:hypothetical protein
MSERPTTLEFLGAVCLIIILAPIIIVVFPLYKTYRILMGD